MNKLLLAAVGAVGLLSGQTPVITDFTPTANAPARIFEGTELTLMYRANVPANSGTLYVTKVEAPAGVAYECYRGHDIRTVCSLNRNAEYGIGEVGGINAFRFRGFPVGKHTVSLTMRVQTVTRTLPHTFEVVAVPDRKLMPELAAWQSTMRKGAVKFCEDIVGQLVVDGTAIVKATTPIMRNTARVLYVGGVRYRQIRYIDTYTVEIDGVPPSGGEFRIMTGFGSFSYEGHAWYYDGARVYFNIADWFPLEREKWQRCAFNVASQYADHIIEVQANKQIYRIFTDGLLAAWQRSGEAKYKEALRLIAEKAPLTSAAGSPKDGHARETAYIVRAFLNYQKAGFGRHPGLTRGVDHMLHLFEALSTDRWREYNQPFWGGLLFSTARDYYDMTGDARILPAIKPYLDLIWNVAHHPDTGLIDYRILKPGDPYQNPAYHSLHQLIIPGYAFYARATGDPEMRMRALELFRTGSKNYAIYVGKDFNQNYWQSFLSVCDIWSICSSN